MPEGNSAGRAAARNRVLTVLLFAIAVLLPGRSGAECMDPTYCYCGLEPSSDDDIIVRAEVTRADYSTVSIRVVGAPFYNPDGLVVSGQVLENLTYHGMIDLAAGDFCLFRIVKSLEGIAFYIFEDLGWYRCIYLPDFPGLDMIEVTQLALSGDCRTKALALLDIDGYCEPIVSGCCNNEVIMRYQPAALLLILGAIRSRRKRSNSEEE